MIKNALKKSKRLFMLVMMIMTMASMTVVTQASGFTKDAIDFKMTKDGEFQITTAVDGDDTVGVFQTLITKVRGLASGATGLVITIIMLVLVVAFGTLAVKSNNSSARAQIGEGILWKLLAVAGVVSVPLLVALAANILS